MDVRKLSLVFSSGDKNRYAIICGLDELLCEKTFSIARFTVKSQQC